MRGYFGIGIENGKTSHNLGTLWRSAQSFGAAFLFTIGRRYNYQASDTTKVWKHIPLFSYLTFEQFFEALPHDDPLIGLELDNTAIPLASFTHPERAVYLLGAEDYGLSKIARSRCHKLVILPGLYCLNVAVAGSIVMFDRLNKRGSS